MAEQQSKVFVGGPKVLHFSSSNSDESPKQTATSRVNERRRLTDHRSSTSSPISYAVPDTDDDSIEKLYTFVGRSLRTNWTSSNQAPRTYQNRRGRRAGLLAQCSNRIIPTAATSSATSNTSNIATTTTSSTNAPHTSSSSSSSTCSSSNSSQNSGNRNRRNSTLAGTATKVATASSNTKITTTNRTTKKNTNESQNQECLPKSSSRKRHKVEKNHNCKKLDQSSEEVETEEESIDNNRKIETTPTPKLKNRNDCIAQRTRSRTALSSVGSASSLSPTTIRAASITSSTSTVVFPFPSREHLDRTPKRGRLRNLSKSESKESLSTSRKKRKCNSYRKEDLIQHKQKEKDTLSGEEEVDEEDQEDSADNNVDEKEETIKSPVVSKYDRRSLRGKDNTSKKVKHLVEAVRAQEEEYSQSCSSRLKKKKHLSPVNKSLSTRSSSKNKLEKSDRRLRSAIPVPCTSARINLREKPGPRCSKKYYVDDLYADLDSDPQPETRSQRLKKGCGSKSLYQKSPKENFYSSLGARLTRISSSSSNSSPTFGPSTSSSVHHQQSSSVTGVGTNNKYYTEEEATTAQEEERQQQSEYHRNAPKLRRSSRGKNINNKQENSDLTTGSCFSSLSTSASSASNLNHQVGGFASTSASASSSLNQFADSSSANRDSNDRFFGFATHRSGIGIGAGISNNSQAQQARRSNRYATKVQTLSSSAAHLHQTTNQRNNISLSGGGSSGSVGGVAVRISTTSANTSVSSGQPNSNMANDGDSQHNHSSSTSNKKSQDNNTNPIAGQSGGGSSSSASAHNTGHSSNSITNNAAGSTTALQASDGTPSVAPPADSESDDSEVGRLQALLESRGLPPHLFGALGPRMTHLLNRTINPTNSSRAQQLLQGLQSTDESQQLQAAIEMCQMLVMGNEDTLAGFPIKQTVPALITLLRMEHNFDMMNHACRALAYMLEALPRSSATVVEAIPVFLEKLQVIQCMDVAEQSLTALEILSRRHNKSILQANGVESCLTYLDFFSINAQRAALAITANCCLNLNPEEFHFVKNSLAQLARLLSQSDKKCVESVCTAFYRLVENFQHESTILQEIASAKELLKNCQQLLIVTPSVLSSGTFTNVIRMLSVMCANCPDLAINLLKNDIASTLLYLLTGSAEGPNASLLSNSTTLNYSGLNNSSNTNASNDIELISRSPSELYEITCLIGELMPRLPTDGIFYVDVLLERPSTGCHDNVQWQWRDDRGNWHVYSPLDSRMIEAAHLNANDEISLSTSGRTYTIDFHSMQQINEDTGTTRPVQRKINPIQIQQNEDTNSSINSNSSDSNSSSNMMATGTVNLNDRPQNPCRDARIACLKEERGLAAEFIKNLFSVLYEVYCSSAGPAVRYKCLRALLRMVFFANSDLLKNVLKNQTVSSHIAGMMASNDLRIVVGALQMAEILMQKLPSVFGIHFRREGVMYQVNLLADPSKPICVSNPSPKLIGVGSAVSCLMSTPKCFLQKPPMPSTSNFNSSSSTSPSFLGFTASTVAVANMSSITGSNSSNSQSSGNVPSASASSSANPHMNFEEHMHDNSSVQSKMADMLKRKVPPKRKPTSSGRSSKTRQSDVEHSPSCPNMPNQLSSASSSVVQDAVVKTVPQLTTSAGCSSAAAAASGRNTPIGNSSARSRFSSNLTNSKTSSFLASLNPARWGRTSSSSGSQSNQPSTSSGNNSLQSTSAFVKNELCKSQSSSNLILAGNREKARLWIREQAIKFMRKYGNSYGDGGPNGNENATSVLQQLTEVIQKLSGNEALNSLLELKNILMQSDISPFEVNHSGLIKAMLEYLASPIMVNSRTLGIERRFEKRDDRLRAFLHVFAGLPLSGDATPQRDFSKILARVESEWDCDTLQVIDLNTIDVQPFSALVAKLNGCVTQLEQFPVKVHDFPAGAGAGGSRSNTSALKFFNTHQLKCNLQRHPACSNLRQWKGGTVKIDPLALVQAIERYLIVRGYGGIRVDSEEDSEEDMDDNVAAAVVSATAFKHKLEFLIGEHVLPYNMTVYQAVRQYSPLASNDPASETETDTETPMGSANIWVQQHTIYYRPIEEDSDSTSGASGRNSSKRISKLNIGASTSQTSNTSVSNISKLARKKSEFWCDGQIPASASSLTPFLQTSLPSDIVTVHDASLDALCMLRIVNALNRSWKSLYRNVSCVHSYRKLIPQSEFVHSKITAKANRQLQDPLVIMTGNLPQWLQQIAIACPFLFPFESRHFLFYAVSFDRDRALQRLLDTTPDLNSADTSERVTPRLDRKKRTISRDEILKQAEHILQEFGQSRALLEIQYENEVGTGLGPTLEFYALVSKELTRGDLTLWQDLDTYKGRSNDIHSPTDRNKSGFVSVKDEFVETNDDNQMKDVIVRSEESSHRQPSMPSLEVTPSSLINQHARDDMASSTNEYVHTSSGLFPSPLGRAAKVAQMSKSKTKFKFLGKFMAKAVMDSRMLDLHFSIPFYRWLLSEEHTFFVDDLAWVVPDVYKTLRRLEDVVKIRDTIQNDESIREDLKNSLIQGLGIDKCVIADLGLDFVLPGYSNVELRRNGRDISVTIENLHQYIALVTHWFLVEGVQKQFEALREGFDSLFPIQRLRMFYPEELDKIFCGGEEKQFHPWDIRVLQECCRTDHGYTQDSRAIQYLYEILSQFNLTEQRLFLQFMTGSPRLPSGGFKALNPPLTIVRKTLYVNENADDFLPSVMTCVNYLKLPDYTAREVMRARLKLAISEGSMSFHLS